MNASQRKTGAPLSAGSEAATVHSSRDSGLTTLWTHADEDDEVVGASLVDGEGWRRQLRGDPLPWLLHPDTPAVRHLALRDLLGRPSDDAEVVDARATAMATDPIAAILAAQHPDGYWEKPGPGYATKYRGTVWQLIFLDQLGADPADERDPARLRLRP